MNTELERDLRFLRNFLNTANSIDNSTNALKHINTVVGGAETCLDIVNRLDNMFRDNNTEYGVFKV